MTKKITKGNTGNLSLLIKENLSPNPVQNVYGEILLQKNPRSPFGLAIQDFSEEVQTELVEVPLENETEIPKQ